METDISEPETNLIFQSPVRERLQMFLQSSDLYDPEEVLDLIEVSEFWWEKVCLNFLINLSRILPFGLWLANFAEYVLMRPRTVQSFFVSSALL